MVSAKCGSGSTAPVASPASRTTLVVAFLSLISAATLSHRLSAVQPSSSFALQANPNGFEARSIGEAVAEPILLAVGVSRTGGGVCLTRRANSVLTRRALRLLAYLCVSRLCVEKNRRGVSPLRLKGGGNGKIGRKKGGAWRQ